MAVYQEMKDSGIAWIGEIPAHWKVQPLKTLLENCSEKNHPNEEVLSLYRDLGVVPKNSRDDNHNVTSEDTAQYKYVRAGNLVINKMKAWQGSLAVSNYAGIVSPAYYVCAFKDGTTHKKFFHYLLRSTAYAQEFEKLSTGMRIGQWDLGIKDFLRVSAVVPPSMEQQAIADYLDEACRQIDSSIAGANSSIEEYKKWKASIIYEAVTKGLDPNVEMKDSGVEWIGEIPKTWSTKSIKYILCESKERTTTGEEEKLSVTQKYGIIKSSEATVANPSISTEDWRIVHQGDIVFNKYKAHSGVFFVSALNGIVTFNYSVYKCLLGNEAKYFEYQFKTSRCIGEFITHMRGVGDSISPLYTTELFKIKAIAPPLKEQKRIVKFLDIQCQKIDDLITEKESLITDLEAYKKSLIYEVVTGKRRVV